MSKQKTVASTNAEKTVPKQLAPFAFQPGNTLGKGRPKGSRNKLGEQFLEALQQDFEANGVKAIVTVRETRPHEYLKVVASILPKELNVNHNALGDMSDDELVGILDGVRALLSAGATDPAGSGSKTQARH